MDSVRVDDGSFIFLREAHGLRFYLLLAVLQPSIWGYSEVNEVSTSLGCTQPFSTEATAMNSPCLLKMQASLPSASPGIWLPCITFDSSVSDTSIRGQDSAKRSIGI